MAVTGTLAPATTSVSGRTDLLGFLTAQRGVVLAIIDGLSTAHLATSVVPSGWTPLGLITHLAGAERFWFQHVVAGRPNQPDAARPDPSSRDAVVGHYRYQCARSDALLAITSLDAAPARPVPAAMDMEHVHDVRSVVLHMVEETARHAGHLDIARELLDGRTGLGPR